MTRFDLQRVGGACAILNSVVLIAVSILVLVTLGSDFVEANDASEFLPILAENKELGLTLAVLLIVAPLMVAVAGMGFFYMFQQYGSLMWLALFGFVGGGLSTMPRAFTWLAMTLELAPAYVEADQTTKPTLAALGDTLETFAVGGDVVGGVLVGGIGVLLFSIAILKTGVAPRWLGWLGIFVAFVGGWLSVLIPVSDVIEAISLLGAVSFWIWMAAMGIIAWRRSTSGRTMTSSLEVTGENLASTREA